MLRAALTMGTTERSARLRDDLPQEYVTFAHGLGLCPIPIPNGHPDPVRFVRELGVEALVLTGGGDIDPAAYGAPNEGSIEIVPRRDSVETALLDLALEHGWPVLGICRGFQMVNVYFGGSLVQDIPSALASPVTHGGGQHPVMLLPGAVRDSLEVDGLTVNTHHHQGVTMDRLAPGLEAFALSEADGIVEGVRHREHPVLAVQWHPERRDYPSAPTDIALFRGLFTREWWA